MYNFSEGDILKDFDTVVIPESTDRGIRFANFVIDWVLSYAFLLIFSVCLGIMLALVNPQISIVMQENAGMVNFFSFLLTVTVRPIYYVLLEGLAGGRTVGKLITGTVAIRMDGGPLTWKDVFARSYARVVPFEAWSGLGFPWHDKWTDTTVVYKRDLMTR